MADFPVSDRVARMHSSATLKAGQIAADLRAAGHDVIDLTVGEPDLDTPDFIKQFAVEGLDKGLTKYTPPSGLRTFTERIAEFYAAEFNTKFSAEEVAASCGGKQGLFNAACALLNPGDEVLIPKPYWVSFPEIAAFCGADIRFLDTESSKFVLTADQVRDSLTPKTRLLIINSPNNPTGRVVPGREIERIVEICAERGVYVLTDECYLFFVYPPASVYTSAALPEELRRWVCVSGSFSKTYAMTGWRIGYTIANEEWTRAIVRLQSHSATHPTSFVQYACGEALAEREKTIGTIRSMLGEYEKRRDWFVPALNAIPGFSCEMPEGAFYALADVRSMIGDRFMASADIAEDLLRRAHVAVTDGSAFGAEGHLRFSYATSLSNLKTAIERISEASKAAGQPA